MKKQARKPNGQFAGKSNRSTKAETEYAMEMMQRFYDKKIAELKKFTCTTTTGYLRIFIDGLLHICIDNTVPILVHSYKQRKDWYCIELQSGEHTVITEYDSKEKWTAILRLLDENI